MSVATVNQSLAAITCKHPGCGALMVWVNNGLCCPSELTLFAHGKKIPFDRNRYNSILREVEHERELGRRRHVYASLPLAVPLKAKGTRNVTIYEVEGYIARRYEVFAQATEDELYGSDLSGSGLYSNSAQDDEIDPPFTFGCVLGCVHGLTGKKGDRAHWLVEQPANSPWLLDNERKTIKLLAEVPHHSEGALAWNVWGKPSTITQGWERATLQALRKRGFVEQVKKDSGTGRTGAGDSNTGSSEKRPKPTILWRLTEKGRIAAKSF